MWVQEPHRTEEPELGGGSLRPIDAQMRYLAKSGKQEEAGKAAYKRRGLS